MGAVDTRLGFTNVVSSIDELAEVYGPPDEGAREKAIDHLDPTPTASFGVFPAVVWRSRNGERAMKSGWPDEIRWAG